MDDKPEAQGDVSIADVVRAAHFNSDDSSVDETQGWDDTGFTYEEIPDWRDKKTDNSDPFQTNNESVRYLPVHFNSNI